MIYSNHKIIIKITNKIIRVEPIGPALFLYKTSVDFIRENEQIFLLLWSGRLYTVIS